jgi:SAM-dependent methyltransferase
VSARRDDPATQLERGAREHYDDPVYYDYTYRRRREDVAFYQRAARQHGAPVLELGVGSGRVAVPLCLDGHAVTGMDLSAPMLAQAEARARDAELPPGRLTLLRGDMRDFDLGARFPLVIAPFNALLHLYEAEDLAACFARVRAHLAPGGRFVFDVRMPSVKELARDPERVYAAGSFVHPTLGVKVKYTEQFRYDALKQVQFVTLRFHPPKGRVVETLLAQRQIFPNELRGLLRLGGLRLAKRLGDFDGQLMGPDADTQIVEAVALEG